MKPKVLVFCEHYRPGYRGGGAMWTVANLVDRFSPEYDFAVVCRNNDGAGDSTPYSEVSTGEWNDLGGHLAFYVDPTNFRKEHAAELITEYRPDLLFVNSVFGLTARVLLEARKKRLIENIPLVVAPCGELSENCLAIKPLKKKAFLKYAKLLGLYDKVIWKATSTLEELEIKRQFGDEVKVMTAPDLVPTSVLPDFDFRQKPKKESGRVRLVSVAHVARKKNISYLLERLLECKRGNFELTLIGGIDDKEYWKRCRQLISEMPPNVKVEAVGPIGYEKVLKQLVESHFFVLPTLNENFGYVFLEALAAGCPLLVSENTIWSGVADAGCGRVVHLERTNEWTSTLEHFSAMNSREFENMSENARNFAMNWFTSSGDLKANREILSIALGTYKNGKDGAGKR